ncbi:ATP-dependent DNA helicase RecG [Gordonia polyisoprenivorans NBRC 16320 = JCM 10675]|uniref:ATP-dependent DNA helicase RecG n=2 Tax=Gordonia polyisoprenivorans TaxID=84595 RepID=A0A846WTD9_9ACTN|nr:ATP-dependent DNA helicase RecG [Gordonia polyisoprenivorans]GAB23945.1 ATP-dependent DNA helicase RecG [Gordonia polyisoprenivorans NBRC 16320 = JCM 10675]
MAARRTSTGRSGRTPAADDAVTVPSMTPGTVTLSGELAGVLGPKTAAGLATIGISTVGELLRYPPRRYVRRGQPSASEELEEGEWVTIVGRVTKANMTSMKSRPGKILRLSVMDEKRTFEVSFFNPYSVARVLTTGRKVMLAGTVKFFRSQPQLTHPQWLVLPETGEDLEKVVGSPMMMEMYEIERAASESDPSAPNPLLALFDRSIIPMYPATSTCQSWEIWSAARRVLDLVGPLPDALDDAQRRERSLIRIDNAVRSVHLPESDGEIGPARERMKFDEALAIQLVLAQRRLAGRTDTAPVCPHVPGGLEDQLLARLPFTLTTGQQAVAEEIGTDLGRDEPMSRLLQGEVGSGKTLVALLAMLRIVDNGHQCALLAPTEVLAAQHYRTISTMLGDLASAGRLGAADGATQLALVTGSMKTKDKRETLLDVVTGQAGIVIGTHALLEENVSFFDLGMFVVDEQHRFGVEQRDTLRGRGRDGIAPHVLVMTATPIPRTVAMTAFGDLDTSVLTELPAGRQPITTNVVPMGKQRWVDRAWERVDEEVAAHRQVYVVCSRIGDDPDSPAPKKAAPKKATVRKGRTPARGADADGDGPEEETVAVIDQFHELLAGPLGKHRIAMLHGRMPADEKAETMDAFGRGEIDILVSTTVIEVGVDVKNATTMVIVDADRFGVSQLHQLRGRVGRGGLPGLCLLMTRVSPGSKSMERLEAVAASNDGFELAQIDLQQRREGDVLGSLQSGGKTSLHFLSLLDDAEIIADARDLAQDIVAADRTLADHPTMGALVDAILVPDKIAYLEKS